MHLLCQLRASRPALLLHPCSIQFRPEIFQYRLTAHGLEISRPCSSSCKRNSARLTPPSIPVGAGVEAGKCLTTMHCTLHPEIQGDDLRDFSRETDTLFQNLVNSSTPQSSSRKLSLHAFSLCLCLYRYTSYMLLHISIWPARTCLSMASYSTANVVYIYSSYLYVVLHYGAMDCALLPDQSARGRAVCIGGHTATRLPAANSA